MKWNKLPTIIYMFYLYYRRRKAKLLFEIVLRNYIKLCKIYYGLNFDTNFLWHFGLSFANILFLIHLVEITLFVVYFDINISPTFWNFLRLQFWQYFLWFYFFIFYGNYLHTTSYVGWFFKTPIFFWLWLNLKGF